MSRILSLPFVSRARRSWTVAEESPASGSCPNCAEPSPGTYCPVCGQAQRATVVSLREMLVDFVEDELWLNSRLPRTVGLLLVYPGFLTAEYLRGRIVRYIRPLRLYLGASIIFFLLLSVLDRWPSVNFGGVQESAASGSAPPAVPAIPADAPLDPEVRARVAEAQRIAEEARAAVPALPGKSWVDEIEIETGHPALQRLLEEKKDRFRGMTPGAAFREVMSEFREHVPTMMFLLLPVFALLLKVLYARRKRLYVEHFVFALHLHALAFALFTLMLVLGHPQVAGVLVLWMLLYTFLAMRRVYGQSVLKTGVKYVVLGWSYSLLLLVGLTITAVVTVLLV